MDGFSIFDGINCKNLGYTELIDIGSGDGRIAFCGKISGFTTHSIEIDDGLVELQKLICSNTEQNFDPHCEDALEFDYSKFQLTNPVFFIGGLPQMGGDVLATSIIDKINCIDQLKILQELYLQEPIPNVNYLEIYLMVDGVR